MDASLGRFKKMDFHVHTPLSRCYEDHVMPEANLHTTSKDILQAAVGVGLSAMVITDHNTAEGIDPMREAAASYNGLSIFPGMEVSARGGHVLGVFDLDTPVADLRRLVSALGFTKEQEGEGYYQSPLWMDEAFALIADAGGLAIAAHIDRQPRGLVASGESLADKVRVFGSQHLSAVEITVPHDRKLWNGGLVPNFPQRRACIQGSDAHAPAEVGRRPIYIDMPQMDLNNLAAAFRDFEARIRFPDELV